MYAWTFLAKLWIRSQSIQHELNASQTDKDWDIDELMQFDRESASMDVFTSSLDISFIMSWAFFLSTKPERQTEGDSLQIYCKHLIILASQIEVLEELCCIASLLATTAADGDATRNRRAVQLHKDPPLISILSSDSDPSGQWHGAKKPFISLHSHIDPFLQLQKR